MQFRDANSPLAASGARISVTELISTLYEPDPQAGLSPPRRRRRRERPFARWVVRAAICQPKANCQACKEHRRAWFSRRARNRTSASLREIDPFQRVPSYGVADIHRQGSSLRPHGFTEGQAEMPITTIKRARERDNEQG